MSVVGMVKRFEPWTWIHRGQRRARSLEERQLEKSYLLSLMWCRKVDDSTLLSGSSSPDKDANSSQGNGEDNGPSNSFHHQRDSFWFLGDLKNRVEATVLYMTGVKFAALSIQLNWYPRLIGPIPTGKNVSIIHLLDNFFPVFHPDHGNFWGVKAMSSAEKSCHPWKSFSAIYSDQWRLCPL